MKQTHYWLAGLIAWFFFFYNIEKLFGVINIATFVYVMVFVYAVLLILVRPLQRLAFHWLLLLSLVPYFLLKVLSDRPFIDGANLPLTVTEICAVLITIALVRQIVLGFGEVRQTLVDLTLGRLKHQAYPFDEGQGQIYHEIRRARRFKREAALLAISPTNQSVKLSLNRFIQEAQREIIDQYVDARIAELLVDELGDSGIIVQRDNHFITLLPESDREDAIEVANRLKSIASESLGLKFEIGIATFPDEAVTFETLLESAEEKMSHSHHLNGRGDDNAKVSAIEAKNFLQRETG